MIKNLLIITMSILFFTLNSCKDIKSTEPRYDKELILENLSPSDSLDLLEMESTDLGVIKVKTAITKNLIFKNISDTHNVKIYKIDNKNKTGLFTYNLISGIPFEIKSLENTDLNQKLEVRFFADAFVPGYFYDTLYINNNPDYFIPIKVKTTY